jgi:hypothetical protein
MSVLTIDKNLMDGLVAKSLPVVEETVLDIKNESIKVFLVSGYCNGEKVEGKFIAKKDDRVDPKHLSFKTFLVKNTEMNLMLEVIDTDAASVFNYTVVSSETEKYSMRNSDGYYKALKVEVAFNYRVDDSLEALNKFLKEVGESSLKVNFLDKSDGFKFDTLKKDIERSIEKAVKNAYGISKSISEFGENVEIELNRELIRLLGQYGITFSGLRATPSDMGNDMLSQKMIADNKEVSSEAEKKMITIDEEIERHKRDEANNTALKDAEQKNDLKEVEGEGKINEAKRDSEIEWIKVKNIATMSPTEIVLYLLTKHSDFLLEIMKASGQQPGTALSGRRGDSNNLIYQFFQTITGSGRQAHPVQMEAIGAEVKPLSETHDASSKRKEGEIYDE